MPCTHDAFAVRIRRRAGGWLAGLAVSACAGPAWALSADSRCGQLGFDICREARASELTRASITWSDGTFTALSPPGGAFDTVLNGSLEEGYRTSLYSNGSLQAAFSQYSGRGPSMKTAYLLDKGKAASATYANSGAYFGQASSNFLHGSTADDPQLHMVGQAESNFGVNRAQTLLQGTVIAPYTLDANNQLRPGVTGQVDTSVASSAYSLWRDRATFSGGGGNVSFQIDLDGTLSANAWLMYALSATDSLGQVHSILGSVVFGSRQPGALVQQLTGTLLVDPSLSYTLSSELVAFTSVPDSVSATTGGAVSAAADFYNTARVDSITVPVGMTLAFGSGSSYLSSRVVTAAVPEPQSWVLMAAGLAALLRRRSRAAPARPA